ncbi:DUF397 domain-containing protein [Spirillospora sp. CA-108201]
MREAIWRKSSRSTGGTEAQCVELASLGDRIGVRDSKAPGEGHLMVGPDDLQRLIGRIKRGDLDIA